MNAKCPRRQPGGGGRKGRVGLSGDEGVETIKPLLLESFVRQMSAGRPVLFKRLLFFFLAREPPPGGRRRREKGHLSF